VALFPTVSSVTNLPLIGRINMQVPRKYVHRAKAGFTLIELLCVIAIIGILLSMLMPALFRTYHRVKDMAAEEEAPRIAHSLRKEVRGYCVANPQYRFDNKSDFLDKCRLVSKCRDWVEQSDTQFVPFDYTAPTNSIVLSVHIGRKHATEYAFTKGELSIPPDGQ